MAEKIGSRRVKIRGKDVTFTAKRLKDGTVAFYRNGKRTWNAYQRRIARGVLEGKTVAEAAGRLVASFTKKWGSKFYGRPDINKNLARYAGDGSGKYGTTDSGEVPWAAPPNRSDGAFDRHRYYALVNVQVQSAIEAGSDIAHDEGAACSPATLTLLANRNNQLTGITRAEFRRDFEKMVHDALRRAGLRLCTGELATDVLGIWRHATR